MSPSPATMLRRTAKRRKCGRVSGQRGYVLLTLLLIVSLMIVATAAVVQTVAFEIKRDREEEMIHRGVQYARAIRTYYKKFGRYPTSIENLENSNNIRFLRKRYKDPISGADFKLLHYGEAKLTLSNLLGGGGIPGANPIGGASGLNGGANGLNGASSFGSPAAGGFGGGAGGFGNSNQNFQNQNSQNQNSSNQNASNQDASSQDPSNPNSGSDASNPNGLSASGDKLSSQVFGGGPIVGVISISKKDGYREFDHKKKYNQWQFIYDPAIDRGGLIKGPNPTIQVFSNPSLQPGQPGQNGQPGAGSPFGTSPGMGNNSSFGGSGFGNNNSSFGGSNSGASTPPPSNPQQQ